MRMSLAEIAHRTNGMLTHPHASSGMADPACLIRSVSIDSRTLEADALFVCIAGNNTDGHSHAKDAVDNGAVAILAEHNPFENAQAPYNTIPVLLVDNTVTALGKLANAHRKTMQGKVIAITGTAGKTTVKELLSHVLQTTGKTAKSAKNFNNQIGLPLSMLAADSDCDYWVMEVGISQAHDMDELGKILQADTALILNAGAGHTAGLGDKGVAHYKARLLAYLCDDGEAIVSADYPDLVHEAKLVKNSIHFFTVTDNAVSYRAHYAGHQEDMHGVFHLTIHGENIEIKTPYCAAFGAENLIAAATVAHRLGISTQNIIRGLSTATLPEQRFNHSRHGNWFIIDDSYNANPLSTKRSLEAALDIAKDKALICVMGEMLELGEDTVKEHTLLGQQLTAASVIFWIGDQFEHILHGLESKKFTGKALACRDTKAFIQAFCTLNLSHGVILFKGSRSNKVERFVEALMLHLQTKHYA